MRNRIAQFRVVCNPHLGRKVRENCTVKTRPSLADSLATNLKRLMNNHASLKSNQALGERSGVGRSTIQRILNKEVFPTLDKLEKIADAFGISCNELLSAGEDQDTSRRQTSKTADEIIEIISLYQQSSDEGREFILDAARRANKVSAALWERVGPAKDKPR